MLYLKLNDINCILNIFLFLVWNLLLICLCNLCGVIFDVLIINCEWFFKLLSSLCFVLILFSIDLLGFSGWWWCVFL